MAFAVFGHENNPRTRLVQIIAAAQEIELRLVQVDPRQDVGVDLFMDQFPLSGGKIPGLLGPGIRLTETIAIAVYLVRIPGPQNLLGNGSPEQEATVLSWMSWANQELLETLAKWYLPLIPNLARPAPYNKEAVEAGKVASLELLRVLEMEIGNRVHLVGDQMSLADIFVAIMVSRGLEWVLDAAWRNDHPNCMRHFDMVRRWGPVEKVVPEFRFVEKEPVNANPYE